MGGDGRRSPLSDGRRGAAAAPSAAEARRMIELTAASASACSDLVLERTSTGCGGRGVDEGEGSGASSGLRA